MGATERDLMERDRDYAAMGLLPPDAMRDLAGKAAIRAYGILNYDPVKAWELLQYAADMMRASLPQREVA